MSWQAYVDTSLVGSGHIDKAAIFDNQGTSVWATSAGFSVSPAEVKVIVDSFNPVSGDAIKEVQSGGFFVGGDKYVALRSDESRLYGKKGKEGVVIVKTKKALLIAHYPETVQPGAATNTVETLGDYLIGLGY
ncbi:profilin-1B [Coccidioides immitis RS]|uniref:Profilin n=7 Tax=Coccidioides TaxID=5500 RepID=J3K6F5_COCIM|nr:profilin-1B [Coccidioides immitis RS]XP_003070680.1 Profilin II, putative [Coccidioides posadasii C735 delta SOWgp]EFW17762.1 profilin-1B [Coccidioides posadasii str. Silveira]KMM68456.1 profilin-2 [Coccidioides posadasii RMSCC 3488]KMP07099.1 profilin-2 [Coccidioides immitis RMSCC 2394]KMU78930.1 profilin-2 [Coccidioides immitis RMSCC 3703]KMU86824.1 profilin-2 [Coccidioides immitis H538.4]TPX22085.1 profilin, required for normal timing of actin polymerization in response to thermal stre|eukprot:XP_003070680.1 Profilin II, putative [Coccidioides posadasii C735 delta SOWgp]